MTRLFAALLALLPAPALALSCLAPSVEDAFTFAQNAPEAYVPVLGTFSGVQPRTDVGNPNPEDRIYQIRFQGIGMTQRGEDSPMNVPVTLQERCLASWCPNVPNGVLVMTFLRVEGQAYVFEIDACGGNAFFQPPLADVATMRACLSAGAC